MTEETVTIPRIETLDETKSFIDYKQRFEAYRALNQPVEKDVDDYLFLHNSVVRFNEITENLNEIIKTINAILAIVDPPKRGN